MESNVCLQVVFYGEGSLVLLVGGGLFSPGLLSRGFGCNFSEIKRFGDSNEIPTDCREKSIEWSGGCGEAENTHRDAYISSSMHTHTHTLCKHIKTPQVYKTTTHTFFRSWCILPERLQTGFLWRNASIQMLQNRVV